MRHSVTSLISFCQAVKFSRLSKATLSLWRVVGVRFRFRREVEPLLTARRGRERLRKTYKGLFSTIPKVVPLRVLNGTVTSAKRCSYEC